MKKILPVLLILLGISISVAAQANREELDDLRREAGLPDDALIRVNEGQAFPAGKLKVYLAVKQSRDAAEDFEGWVEKWNRKDGGKYGMLEIANDPTAADIIVAQYKTGGAEYVAESKVDFGKLSTEKDSSPGFKVDSDSRYKRLDLPIYSYLMVRSNGFWVVVFRLVETSLPGKQLINPDARIRGDLKKRLKDR
ncbi:MAG: hypothetical protein R2747_20885 [Pyrinomonadaceae bacterium]